MLSQRLAPYLRPLLLVDALSCSVFAAGLLGAGPALSRFLSIPEPWLFHGGVICLVSALFGAWLMTRPAIPARGVLLLAGANVLWGIVSVVAVLLGWIQPTPFGTLLTIVQGLAVLFLGEFQILAVRGRPLMKRYS